MKLYIIVDRWLTKPHRAVQAGHAVAAYLKENPDTPWTNGTLVYLKSDDIHADSKLCDSVWVEPDWDNKLTAAACLGKDELWAKHKLL